MKTDNLNYEFQKGLRRNTWELRVKAAISVNASICEDIAGFKRAFDSELARYPRESVGHISTSYRSEIEDNACKVYFLSTRTSDRRLIAIIKAK